jgi:hypothetical protein
LKHFLKVLGYKVNTPQTMAYTGDVYDSPPIIVRVAMTAACVFGAIFTLWFLIPTGLVVPIILVASGLVFALFLVWVVPRASQTALVTVAYWALLGTYALLLPWGA